MRHANQAGFEERSTLQRSSHSVHTTLTVVQPVHCASLTHTLGVVTKHILLLVLQPASHTRMLASYFVSLSVLLCLHCQPQVHLKKKKKIHNAVYKSKRCIPAHWFSATAKTWLFLFEKILKFLEGHNPPGAVPREIATFSEPKNTSIPRGTHPGGL